MQRCESCSDASVVQLLIFLFFDNSNNNKSLRSDIFILHEHYEFLLVCRSWGSQQRRENKMAMGTIVGYWVVNSFVESVVNTKIPDLLVVMERVRAGYLAQFDAVLLMLEREIHSLIERLKALGHRIVSENRYMDLRDSFGELWVELNDVFMGFCCRCVSFDIYVHDEECLVLTEDESHSSSDDDEPSPGREE